MHTFDSIPSFTWVYWLGGLAAVTLALWLFWRVRRTPTSKQDPFSHFLGGFMLISSVTLFAIGLIQWDNHVSLTKAIKADPVLSKAATIAEAIAWMDEEVNPILLRSELAINELEQAEIRKAAAEAEVKAVNNELEEARQELIRRFGHLMNASDKESAP